MSIRSRELRADRPAGSRMEPESELTDAQWRLIADLFPYRPSRPAGDRTAPLLRRHRVGASQRSALEEPASPLL
jgi:hypothetical protein